MVNAAPLLLLLLAAPGAARVDGKVTRPKVQPQPESGTAAAAPIPAEIVFSKSLGGPQAAFFTAADTIYGRVTGVGPDDAYGCIEIPTKGDRTCSDPAKFVKLPNQDWSYREGVWRATFKAGNFPADVYRAHFRRGLGGSKLSRSLVIGPHSYFWGGAYNAACGTPRPRGECTAENVGEYQTVPCGAFTCSARHTGPPPSAAPPPAATYHWSAGPVFGPCNPGAAPAAACNAGTAGATVPHSCGGQWTCVYQ